MDGNGGHRGRIYGEYLARYFGAPDAPPATVENPEPPPPAHPRVRALLEARDWPALEDAYELLPPDQQRVLDLRYGLRPNDPEQRAPDEVAALLGVELERVEDSERQAIDQLAEQL